MVLGFWNNQINLVFSLLGQSPVSFKGGGTWAVVESLQLLFVGVWSGLVVLFFVIGFCTESVAMGLTAKQLIYSNVALGSGCLIVFYCMKKSG